MPITPALRDPVDRQTAGRIIDEWIAVSVHHRGRPMPTEHAARMAGMEDACRNLRLLLCGSSRTEEEQAADQLRADQST